jgi:hypothetical protein
MTDWIGTAPKLLCPSCDGDYLHHGAVEVWDRAEDAPGSMARVENGTVTVAAKEAGFLGRRGDVRILFNCEGCRAELELRIVQHKGQTFMAWSTGVAPKLRA